METLNEVAIAGDPDTILPIIYGLAADLEQWPVILPHYRYMRFLERSEKHSIADYGASRNGFPVRWRARQDLFPDEPRIEFKHIGGITKGMWVEWRFERLPSSVRVTIFHKLSYPVPLLGPFFAHYIVGNLFVSNIANKTLNCIKRRVEAQVKSAAK